MRLSVAGVKIEAPMATVRIVTIRMSVAEQDMVFPVKGRKCRQENKVNFKQY